MHITKKIIGVHKKELKNAGYMVKQKREERKTFYTVISKGKIVLEVVKFQDKVVAMNRKKYLFCDKAAIEFKQGKALVECYTYYPEGVIIERIEEVEEK